MQLLVDCCYPPALADPALVPEAGQRQLVERRLVEGWLGLSGAQYQRTRPLRARLTQQGLDSWGNGAGQALLDPEADYCGVGGCAVCPLGRLARQPVARCARPSTNFS